MKPKMQFLLIGAFLFGMLLGYSASVFWISQNNTAGQAGGLRPASQNQPIINWVAEFGFCKSEIYYIKDVRVELYCFNAVNREGLHKPSHIDRVEEILTTVEETGPVYNPFFQRDIDPSEVFQRGMMIVDASAPSLIHGNPDCEGHGDANYQNPGYDDKPTIYLCYGYFELPSRVQAAGIMYHEATHQYWGSHDCKTAYGYDGDEYPDKVYGAHINFLLAISQSQNPYFTCKERDEAHSEAIGENTEKICNPDYIDPNPPC